MAAVPVTLVGTFTQDDGRTYNGTFTGLGVITGLGVGGGPIVPPSPPVGIWPNPPEGIAPHPEHPIVLPPPHSGAHPEHPIVLPPEPPDIPPGEPQDDGMVKDPPANGGWGYNQTFGWGYFPGKSGAGPK